jgi:glycosyltransferase involved in cell wall biosynthesis
VAVELEAVLDGTPLLGQRTGIGRYTACLAEELAELAAVRLVAFTVRGWRKLRDLAPRGTRAVGWPVPARLLRTCWRAAPLPPVELLTGPASVVHGTNFVLPPTARAAGVVTVHDLAFLDDPRLADADLPALVRTSVRRARVVCTPSRAVAEAVQERLGAPEHKLVVTPLGVAAEWFTAAAPDEPLRRRLGLPDEYLVFVGADGPRKGLADLLRVHRDLDLPPLVVAGPGRAVRDERVIRTGYLTESELRRVVAGARALVLPSRDEGFGLPVLEAFACGVPVVCSDVPALREVSGGRAQLFRRGDDDSLRDALRRVLSEPVDPAALQARAAGFTWRRCAERTLAAYRRALS